MPNKEKERYRQILLQVLTNCAQRLRPTDEPMVHPDVNDLAAVNHARYIAEVKEGIHYSVCDAARKALARLEDGEYGLCLDCGDPISTKRLAAVPWAECCIECQSARESGYAALRKAA